MHQPQPCHREWAPELAALLNAAWNPARRLPRIVARAREIPFLCPQDIERHWAEGWPVAGCQMVRGGGRLLSVAQVRMGSDGQGLLGWLATHPDCRRQGFASACLRAALEDLRNQGATLATTAGFVDSRMPDLCGFLESHGFRVMNPDRQNVAFRIDIAAYQPRPVQLPQGYRLNSLDLDNLEPWLAAKNRIFESHSDRQWFMDTYGSREGFDPSGWQVLWHGAEVVGMAGADVFRDSDWPGRVSGCSIEYVGIVAEHRGHGLGEALMIACLNHAATARAQVCVLITQPFRTAAVRLYEKLGFHLVRELRIYRLDLT